MASKSQLLLMGGIARPGRQDDAGKLAILKKQAERFCNKSSRKGRDLRRGLKQKRTTERIL